MKNTSLLGTVLVSAQGCGNVLLPVSMLNSTSKVAHNSEELWWGKNVMRVEVVNPKYMGMTIVVGGKSGKKILTTSLSKSQIKPNIFVVSNFQFCMYSGILHPEFLLILDG